MVLLYALMSVPGLFQMSPAGIELHETHTALNQPPCNKAVPSELRCLGVVHPIHIQGFAILLCEVDRFGNFALHPKRKLVTRDAGSQFLPALAKAHMLL